MEIFACIGAIFLTGIFVTIVSLLTGNITNDNPDWDYFKPWILSCLMYAVTVGLLIVRFVLYKRKEKYYIK